MSLGLVGRKRGMTRVFTDAGETVPVTVIEALPNRVAQVKTWWVMEAPTGQRFCVIRPQRDDFQARAMVREA